MALATARKAAMRDGLAATGPDRSRGALLARCGEPMGDPAASPTGSGYCGDSQRDASGLPVPAVLSVHRRIIDLTANCGVLLSDAEVDRFMGFLGKNAAEV